MYTRRTDPLRIGRARHSLNPMNLHPYERWRSDHGIVIATGVSTWAGLCGRLSLTQGTAANQPARTASVAAINNKPSVDFDGVNDVLAVADTLGAQPYHVFAVAKYNSVFAAQSTLFDSSGGNRLRLFRTAAGNLTLFAGASLAVTGATETSWQLWEGQLNGASSKVFQSGTQLGSTGNAGTNGANGVTLGAFGGGASDWSNSSFAEFIWFTRILSANEVSYIKRYVSKWYGLTIA